MYRKRKYTKHPKFSKDKEKFTRRQKDGMIIRCKPQDIFQRLNIPNYIKIQNTIDTLKENPSLGQLNRVRSLVWDLPAADDEVTLHLHPEDVLHGIALDQVNKLRDDLRYVLVFNLQNIYCYNVGDSLVGVEVRLNGLPTTYNRQNIKNYGLAVYNINNVIEYIIDDGEIGYQTIISNQPGYTYKLAQWSTHATGAEIKRLYSDDQTVITGMLFIVTTHAPGITKFTINGELFLYPEQ